MIDPVVLSAETCRKFRADELRQLLDAMVGPLTAMAGPDGKVEEWKLFDVFYNVVLEDCLVFAARGRATRGIHLVLVTGILVGYALAHEEERRDRAAVEALTE